MLVGERMSHPVITVHPDTSLQDALHLMHTEHIRLLPVVEKKGNLVGIVTERDLIQASPSEATSLSVWEVSYLLSKITIQKIMTSQVITVSESTPLEEAARIMADNKVTGLPVVRGEKLVGIITETDLFRIFLEMLGARERGVRISAIVPDEPGKLSEISTAICSAGGNIVAVGTFMGESSSDRELTIKVDGIDQETLLKLLEPHIISVVDARTMPGT
jgi:acetoin utilization protein AcuB